MEKYMGGDIDYIHTLHCEIERLEYEDHEQGKNGGSHPQTADQGSGPAGSDA